MIDWKQRCLELAEIVNRHRKDRLHRDMQQAWEMAKELIRLGKVDDKASKKFMEWWRCEDKDRAVKIYAEYLELIRECC